MRIGVELDDARAWVEGMASC